MIIPYHPELLIARGGQNSVITGGQFSVAFSIALTYMIKMGGKHGFDEAFGLWFMMSMPFDFILSLLAFSKGWKWYRKKLEKNGYTLKPEAVSVSISPAPQESTAKNQADKLRELDKLHKDGILTDVEFQEKRKTILDSM